MRTLRDILNLLFFPSLLITIPYILLCIPTTSGLVPFEVRFESMNPTYNSGELVYYTATKASDLKVGDLVVYDDNQIENTRVFHRIVEIKADGLVTKADGKDFDDEDLLKYEDVIGKVVGIKIPLIGPYLNIVNNNMIVIYASVGFWAFYGLLNFIICLKDFKKKSKMKKEKKAAALKKQEEAKKEETPKEEKAPKATPAKEEVAPTTLPASGQEQAPEEVSTPLGPVEPQAPADPQDAAPAEPVEPAQ